MKMRRVGVGFAALCLGVLVSLAHVVLVSAYGCDSPPNPGGRPLCKDYFTGTDIVQEPGEDVWFIMTGGLERDNVQDVDGLVNVIKDRLFNLSGTTSWTDQGGAAFIVLNMLNVPGPDTGGTLAAGVAKAQAMFPEWEARVRSYATTPGYGIDFNYVYNAPAGYINSGGSIIGGLSSGTYTGRYAFLRIQEAETFRAVRFYGPAGTITMIERACANLVNDPYLPPVAEPKNWTIDGTTSLTSGQSTITPGETATWRNEIRNAGPDATDQPVTFRVLQTYGGGAPTQVYTRSLPAGYALNTTLDTNTSSYAATAADVGKQICRYAEWTPASTSSPAAKTTLPVCVTVAKTPYFAGVGGDIFGGGSFAEPCTGVGGVTGSSSLTFGAFGEYGVGSTGTIKDVASAGTMDATMRTSLTFANTPSFGNYAASHCITDLATAYSSQASAASAWSGGTLNGNSGMFAPTADNISISGQTIPTQRKYVVYAPGKSITITGNILYDTGINSFAEAPQLIVIADNIRIDAAVTRLDGIFFAKNVFNTCREASDNPNTNRAAISAGGACQNTLRINGAVIAGSVVLPRTNGGTTGTNPAETFVMRPDSFLTDYELSRANASVITEMMIELPPRY